MLTEQEYRDIPFVDQHGNLLSTKRQMRSRTVSIVVAPVTNLVTYVRTPFTAWEGFVVELSTPVVVVVVDLPKLPLGGGDD